MLVGTLITLLTSLRLLEELTDRKLVFIEHMQEFTLTALLAGVLHPMYTHALLPLILLNMSVERAPFSIHVIDTMLLIRHD